DAGQTLARLGATVEEIALPDYELFNACGRILMFCEAYAVHEETLRTRPLDYGAWTYMRMALGAFLTAVDLTQALRRRYELSRAVNLALTDYDAILTASSLGPAGGFDTPLAQPPTWPFQTIAFNVTGNPAIAMPAGFSSDGLPLS